MDKLQFLVLIAIIGHGMTVNFSVFEGMTLICEPRLATFRS